jgi:hypothetical protein
VLVYAVARVLLFSYVHLPYELVCNAHAKFITT